MVGKALRAAWGPLAVIVTGLSFVASLAAPTARAEETAGAQGASPTHAAEDLRPLLPFRTVLRSVMTWEAEFGAGLQLEVPIMGKTGHHSGHDELAVTFGCDASFVTFAGKEHVTIWPTATLQWSLSINERIVFYPEAGVVADVRPGDFKGLYPSVGFGVRVNMYRSIAAVARLGWPMAAALGLTF